MDSRATTEGARLVAGRYRLLEPLGSGGMGTVWRGLDEVLGREVAVKEMTFPRGVSDAERDVLRERTRREARAAARLDHPSAVTVFDVVEDDDRPYLVMELVEARTLAEVVRSDGPLSPERTAEVGLAVLGALRAAHAQGIVHRDVKPGNVLLGHDGRVVLTDFGIATSTGDSALTSTGLLLGSPSYIAPERARGEAPGPASDLWSLGATLFTAVEGRPPYDGGEPLLTVTAVVTGEHAPYAAAGPLEPVLDGLLGKDPATRMTPDRAASLLAGVRDGSAPAVPAAPPLPDPGQEARAERTSALPLGAVHERAAATPPPPSDPRAPSAPLPGSPRPVPRRAAVLGAAAVVAALVVGVAGVVATRDDDGAGTERAGSSPSAGASSSGSPEPGRAGGDSAAAVPADWVTYTDPDGWTLRHPPSWTVSERNGLRQFRDERTRRTLRVDSTTSPKADPVADWRTQAVAFDRTHDDYDEVSIAAADYRGLTTADWEFTYRDAGADLHVVNRGLVVPAGGATGARGYALFWQVPADDWEAARPVFDQLAAGFEPA